MLSSLKVRAGTRLAEFECLHTVDMQKSYVCSPLPASGCGSLGAAYRFVMHSWHAIVLCWSDMLVLGRYAERESVLLVCAGGTPARVAAVNAIVRAGVACMGHLGLTPQSVSALGGFRPQAKNADAALNLVKVAQVRQSAACI